MFFKHFIADDFIRYQDLLHKKISHESMTALLRASGEPFHLVEHVFKDMPHYTIEVSKPNHIVILGKSFNKVDRARKYNSIKTWLEEDGFPVLCDVNALRGEYPNLNMLTDTIMCIFVYACLFPGTKLLTGLQFPLNEDTIKLFSDGFEEAGITSEWDGRQAIPFTKMQYIIQVGRGLQETADAS